MDPFHGADKKLGELMLRGWTMLSNSCSTCNCPLMRSPDGQKYCVNCEVWVYDNKKREPKKYSELFSSRTNQIKKEKPEIPNKKEEYQKNDFQQKRIIEQAKDNKEKEKEKEKEEEIKKTITPKNNQNDSLITSLDNKLKTLAQNLNNETDIKKSKEIIELMDNILGLIEHYKKIFN